MKHGKIELTETSNLNELLYVKPTGEIGWSDVLVGDITAGGGNFADLSNVSITSPVSGDILRYDGTNWVNKGALEDNIFIVQDEKAASTNGGSFLAGAWRTRDLNTVHHDAEWASLASNQITISGEGFYDIWAECPAYSVRGHQTKLTLISGSGTANLYGGSDFARSSSTYSYNNSVVLGTIEVSGAWATYELQHRCSSNEQFTGTGFGQYHLSGLSPNIYSIVKVEKR